MSNKNYFPGFFAVLKTSKGKYIAVNVVNEGVGKKDGEPVECFACRLVLTSGFTGWSGGAKPAYFLQHQRRWFAKSRILKKRWKTAQGAARWAAAKNHPA